MTRHDWFLIPFLAVAAVAQPPGAQAAPVIAPTVRYFGVTCGPASPEGSPTILIVSIPRIGGRVVAWLYGTWGYVAASGCRFQGWAYLLVGVSNQQAGGVPLPYLLPLALTQNHPCLVQVSSEWILRSELPLAGQGSTCASYSGFEIPNVTALVGQKLYLQWLVNRGQVGAACPYPVGYSFTSNAAEITIGY